MMRLRLVGKKQKENKLIITDLSIGLMCSIPAIVTIIVFEKLDLNN